jgi:hypothetical protein
MLFGLFGKKAPVEVKVRKEVNFKIDFKMTEKEVQQQLNKIVRDIEDQTGFKAIIKKTEATYRGEKLNGHSCKSLIAWVDFNTMTEKKEDTYAAINRVNFALNEIDENTNKFNIEYMN